MIKALKRLNFFIIFLTLLAYLAPFVSPQTMSLLMFAGLMYPWLLLANVLFIGLWGLSRMRHWWYSAACILLGWGYVTRLFGLSFSAETPEAATPSIKVVSYNLNQLKTRRFRNRVEGWRGLNTFFAQQNADVLCLPELEHAQIETEEIKTRLPFLKNYPSVVRADSNQTAIFSKYPIVNRGIAFVSKNNGNGGTFADVNVNNRIVRFYCLHLQSNEVSNMADELSESGNIEEKEWWLDVFRMLRLFRKMGLRRAREAEDIARHIRSSPYPVVVCGDFNDIPVSYTYQTIADGLQDAFQEKGLGLGTTYDGNIPALKIDYILTHPDFHVYDCAIWDVPYSDHFPVVSIFGFEK